MVGEAVKVTFRDEIVRGENGIGWWMGLGMTGDEMDCACRVLLMILVGMYRDLGGYGANNRLGNMGVGARGKAGG